MPIFKLDESSTVQVQVHEESKRVGILIESDHLLFESDVQIMGSVIAVLTALLSGTVGPQITREILESQIEACDEIIAAAPASEGGSPSGGATA